MQPELLEAADAEISELVRHELKALLGMHADPAFSIVSRYTRSMPQYHVGHLDRVQKITERVTTHQGLELAGNAYVGVGIPDSIASGYAAADRLNQQTNNGQLSSSADLRLNR